MVSYIFQTLAKKGKAEGVDSSNVADAREWFRGSAQQIKSVNRNRMMKDPENIKHALMPTDIGRMYMFFYDPKLKETLPYYDTFPLIFLIGFKDNGYLGINLHYLPHVLRAKLMDSLYEIANNNKMDKSTKLRVSYHILSSASKYRWFKPCVKHYLWDHVKGNFLNIEPTNWDSALMLPTEQFRKATKDAVWRDSREMI